MIALGLLVVCLLCDRRKLEPFCSASRLTAGALGFLTFTQWAERPER